MIFKRIDLKSYKAEFEKKFVNFGEKAPIMLSYFMDDLGVTVVCENSGAKYFYEWDVTIPVKLFIHNIKQNLSENHYPRICRDVEIVRSPNEDEIAEMISSGTPLDAIPDTITYKVTETYRIDKILTLQDILILVNEATKEQYSYHYEGSIYFLRNYRNGVYKSLYEAGNEFFRKAELIAKLDKIKN